MTNDTDKPSPMTIILGGINFEAAFRDGSKEEVKVRLLPVEFMGEWALLQGDEAGLVELYCDRQDKLTPDRLNVLRTQELRLLEMLGKAEPEQFDSLDIRLAAVREKIVEAEKNVRWDSRLVPESHNEILRIGEELNRPTFDRWATNRVAAIGQTKETTAKLKSLSESLQPSAASSSE
jgi:hypothetical protein